MKIFSRDQLSLLGYLLLLMSFFIFMEISFCIQSHAIYFNDLNLISRQITLPLIILPEIFFFIFAQFLIHFSAIFYLWISALILANIFKLSQKGRDYGGLILVLIAVMTILLANQVYFPNSKFAFLTRFMVSDKIAQLLLFFLSSLWVLMLALQVYWVFISLSWKQNLSLIMLGLLGGYWTYSANTALPQDTGTVSQPNIILIGIDSLRPDFLGYWGSSLHTPFFNSFLSRAVIFTQAYTPLARTFPAWMSILSGQYPKKIGIRFDLNNRNPSQKFLLLSQVLHQQGYKTVFATDETRFSNIDRSYGFDEIISPPMGVNDFLLGSINDFPLSNLIINTVIGKWLFPYSYANRPVYISYDPNSFIKLLNSHLRQARGQPLFLAIHFCLPHYPYLWAEHSEWADADKRSSYRAAIERVDQQVSDLMVLLSQDHLLQHAIVVLLSDHGEALELSGDRITAPSAYLPSQKSSTTIPRFYPPSIDQEAVDQSVGHGTDVLGFSQYHSLLAFRFYGFKDKLEKKIADPVSLLDIKPTILDFLNNTSRTYDKISGVSLRPMILGQAYSKPLHPYLFLESDFSPQAVRSVHPETRKLIFEGINYFRIDPQTARIFIKESMEKLILSSKQYAVMDKNWVLALYPQSRGKMIAVLVERNTGKWTLDLNQTFAEHSPANRMLSILKEFYGEELKEVRI